MSGILNSVLLAKDLLSPYTMVIRRRYLVSRSMQVPGAGHRFPWDPAPGKERFSTGIIMQKLLLDKIDRMLFLLRNVVHINCFEE